MNASAYIILKDRDGKTLTVPHGIAALCRSRLLNGSTYIGTFWAFSWDEAKMFFNAYCGY
jgi:hypothetical protein